MHEGGRHTWGEVVSPRIFLRCAPHSLSFSCTCYAGQSYMRLLFIVYCYLFYRHILASLHFNENIQRETQLSRDGNEYIRVTYPKFKLGEEVVREVACPPTYGMITWLEILCNCFSGNFMHHFNKLKYKPLLLPPFFILWQENQVISQKLMLED